MKILPFLLVISYGLLLALPEVTGAPVADCGSDGKKGAVVYEKKTEAEKSRVYNKTESEERDVETEQNVCSNGLISGKKEYSVSREMNEEELEKSRKASEVKTATGSEKATESAKKKSLVSANSKQSVVVYYLVSYKSLPVQKKGECMCDYYKRVFPKEKNVKIWYHKIFKVYEKEEPKQYIARIEYIFDKVYPELDPRLDINYLDFFDHYYTQKYCRKIGEADDHYYARVLKRFDCESFEHYKNRMKCLEASLDEEDFEHVTFVDTELGFVAGKRKRPVKSVSSPSSSGIKYGNYKNEKKKVRKELKNRDASESSEQIKSNKGSSVKEQRKLHTTDEIIEKEEEINCYSYKVAYTKLPKKKIGQSDIDYYKEFFGEFKSNMTNDQRNELYLKMLIQYKGEDNQEYVQRIDYLFDKVYPHMDIRTNKILISMLDHYYREKYRRLDKEPEEQWISRILQKGPSEPAKYYTDRMFCIESVFNDNFDFSKVVIDPKLPTGFSIKGVVVKAPPKDKKKKECSCPL